MCGFAMPSRITCAVIATTFPNCFTVAHSVCCLMPWKPVWEASLLAGSTSLTGSGWRENEAVNRKEITEQATSLEHAADGLCEKSRLLDCVENFILFHKGETKITAQNHQFLGVNNAYERFCKRSEYDGKLGVFWQTQGSGKSFSMIFYARKIFRKATGNFSFVVVTDRQDLDGQIYRNFLNAETVRKEDAAQPANAEEMRKFLGQNKKVVFTLIQKFRHVKGRKYPRLFDPEKENREIIVMVDEAHRTQ